VLALRGTAFFALNLVATTSAGTDLLSRFGNTIALYLSTRVFVNRSD
jgi:Rapamycin-insensitive companion of mTOR, domain 5